jgi:hypothetical protein
MPRENANQSIKPKAVRSAGEPDQVNDRVAKPSPFISSAGLAKAVTQPPILALLWIGVFVHLWSMFETLRTRTHKWDFSLYYLGSYAQSHGINPYTANLVPLAHRLGLQPGLRAGNFDPPFMVIAMEPLTWMSVTAAYWTWFAVNVVALSVALYLLIGRYSSLDRRSASAFVALALIYPPLGTHFYYAQSQIVALLLLVLIMRSMEWDRQSVVGVAFALLSVLRTYPLALGGYFLIRRNWRALVFAALVLSSCLSLTILFAGIDPWRDFFQQVNVSTMDDYSNGPANVALVHTVKVLFALVIGNGSRFAAARLVTATVASIIVLILSVKITIDTSRCPDSDWRVYSLWVVTMLVVSPVTWVHSMILLILPFAKLTIAAFEGRASHRAMWMAVASYLMVSVATGWYQHVGSHDSGHVSAIIAELSPLSLIAAYVSAYWFATDRDFPAAKSAVAA